MKHKGFKRYVSILLAVILVMGMLPLSILTASAFVADLTYYTASWDDSTGEVITTGASLPEGAVDLTVKYPGLPYAITFENGGFYYVSHSCTYNERAAVSGHATLFIPDGVALECQVRLRHRQPLQACRLTLSDGVAHMRFPEAQRAVTPGQSAVFYQDRVCLGGCIVDAAED